MHPGRSPAAALSAAILLTALGVPAVSTPAFSNAGNDTDPETGYICVDLPCNVLKPRDNNNVICQRSGATRPDGTVAVRCFARVNGRWVEQ